MSETQTAEQVLAKYKQNAKKVNPQMPDFNPRVQLTNEGGEPGAFLVGKLLKIRARVDTIPFICVDVANGYTVHFVNCVKEVRQHFPNSTIMAGNVCTPEMVSELILSGAADIVKIGIGPGSVCRTRHMTGVGYPQLSAIMECADAAHGLQGHICADGGCREPGHVVKAFAANADFVMLGGMLAGAIDGIADALKVDDSRFRVDYPREFAEVRKPGCVVFEVEGVTE